MIDREAGRQWKSYQTRPKAPIPTGWSSVYLKKGVECQKTHDVAEMRVVRKKSLSNLLVISKVVLKIWVRMNSAMTKREGSTQRRTRRWMCSLLLFPSLPSSKLAKYPTSSFDRRGITRGQQTPETNGWRWGEKKKRKKKRGKTGGRGRRKETVKKVEGKETVNKKDRGEEREREGRGIDV